MKRIIPWVSVFCEARNFQLKVKFNMYTLVFRKNKKKIVLKYTQLQLFITWIHKFIAPLKQKGTLIAKN